MLVDEPACIYCGGEATSIEHMPPIILFDNRDRPRGLEFSACEHCNAGTRLTDQVIAMLCRSLCDRDGARTAPDSAKIMLAVANNDPKTLLELQPTEEQIARTRGLINGGPINIGPRMQAHMRVFLGKLGMSLFRHVSGVRLSNEGAVRAAWYSNYQALTQSIPPATWSDLPPFEVLTQGKKTSNGQFEYSWSVSDTERLFRFVAVFRFSFMADILVATDRMLLDDMPRPDSEVRPGELLKHVPRL